MNDEGVNRETAVSVFTFSKLNMCLFHGSLRMYFSSSSLSFPSLPFLFFFFLSPAPAFARSLRQAHHVCVRTLPPWWWASYMCRPHGVAAFARCFLYHLWKQGDQRTMRYHFLNPCFIFSTLSFSSFVQTGAFYFPLFLLLSLGKLSWLLMRCFFRYLHQNPAVSLGFIFVTEEQWWMGRRNNDDHPSPLTACLALYLPVKWLVWPRTGHQNEFNPLPI